MPSVTRPSSIGESNVSSTPPKVIPEPPIPREEIIKVLAWVWINEPQLCYEGLKAAFGLATPPKEKLN